LKWHRVVRIGGGDVPGRAWISEDTGARTFQNYISAYGIVVTAGAACPVKLHTSCSAIEDGIGLDRVSVRAHVDAIVSRRPKNLIVGNGNAIARAVGGNQRDGNLAISHCVPRNRNSGVRGRVEKQNVG
jgi:hypothetical protein